MMRDSVPGAAPSLRIWSISMGILATGLLLVLAVTVVPGEAVAKSLRLPNTVQPTHQKVTLRVDPSRQVYTGSTQIDLDITETVTSIRLHAEGLLITDLGLVDALGKRIDVSWVGGTGRPPSRPEESSNELLIRAADTLSLGTYVLSMEFANEFNRAAVGLYRTDFDGEGYAFTQFEADDAREAFPCFDEPAFKIPFQMIVEVPSGQTVVGNTPIATTASHEGWDRVEFTPTRPLPTYLLMIAVGPFDSIEMPGLGVPARIYTPHGQSHLAQLAAEITPPLLHALEAYFGSSYPYSKLDFVAVPEYWPGAMEHSGAITFADALLLQDPHRTSPSRRGGLARTIAHELAHQWFGDWVTMEWWNDLWLNESFADWLTDKVAEQIYPEFDFGVESEIDAQQIFATDARATTQPIRKAVTDTGNLLQGLGIAYNKGKAVLRTFENWIGPEEFREGVIHYLEANAWSNATADDLWAAIAAQSSPAAAAALASFVEQPSFPLVSVDVLPDGRVWLHQERFRNRGARSPDQLWKIPVSLKYPLGDGLMERTFFLEGREQMVQLEASPSWILPKAGGSSYYRWTVAPEVMERLYSLDPNLLDVRERIDLLANASSLFDAGRMTGDFYLDILTGFREDPDPRVIRFLLASLESVRNDFITPGLEDDFAVFVRLLLRTTWDRIGPEPREGEDLSVTLLRPRLFLWLGREGRDPEIRAAARAYVDALFGVDPALGISAVPPSLTEPAVRVAAATGDAELFDLYVNRFATARDPGDRRLFLRALAYFDDPNLFRRALDVCLNHPKIRSNEVTAVTRRADYPDFKIDARYNWLEENYDEISKRIPGIFLSLLPNFVRGCNVERLERAMIFFSKPEHLLPGTKLEMAKVEERVLNCEGLRGEEGRAIASYLALAARPR